MVKHLQSIDLDKVRFYMSTGSIVGVISLIIWAINISSSISARKTEIELNQKQEKVSTTAFASMQTDISYMKDDIKYMKTSLQQLLEKKG